MTGRYGKSAYMLLKFYDSVKSLHEINDLGGYNVKSYFYIPHKNN